MRKNNGLGKKKDLNAELNLTPFIDLLSSCVCFLLITAVWIEVGKVEIKQSSGTEAQESKQKSYDLDVVFTNPTSMSLNLKQAGKRVKTFAVKADSFEATMLEMKNVVKNNILVFNNKPIEIATATITPRSDVDYGNLISTLDVLRENNIINIGVLTAKGQ